jgi:hypothetical protein
MHSGNIFQYAPGFRIFDKLWDVIDYYDFYIRNTNHQKKYKPDIDNISNELDIL